jgi:hypothetical protein
MGNLRAGVQVALLSLLTGFIAGAGLTLYVLSEFSFLPSMVALLFPVIAGGFIGALIPKLGRALGSILLVIVISIVVSMIALSYPEFQVNRLGTDVALELSLTQALQGTIWAAPLALVGLLLGKFMVRGE